ncbi:MAG: hypothetical protein DRN49_02555 [Thaumarchaeota archaeon]|nr:MAG: hypothetical protein DRN49_02555 [Nitrososphaerota archaeon]
MKIAVIGVGAMGGLFTRYFVEKGFRVKIYDKMAEKTERFREIGVEVCKELKDVITDVEAILLAIPIIETGKLIENLSKTIRRGILIEITSLKLPIIEHLKKLPRTMTPVSIHPLFGPSVKRLRGEKMALIPVRNPDEELEIAEKVFDDFKLFTIEAEKHDRLMTYILSLTRIISLASAISLKDEDLEELIKFSGVSFRKLIEMMACTSNESLELFTQLLILNKYSEKIASEFLDSLQTIVEAIKLRDFEKLSLLYETSLRSFGSKINFLEGNSMTTPKPSKAL